MYHMHHLFGLAVGEYFLTRRCQRCVWIPTFACVCGLVGFGWVQVALAADRAGLPLEAYRAADAALALPADLPAALIAALAVHRARTIARSRQSKKNFFLC
jgi:hypothetical protein